MWRYSGTSCAWPDGRRRPLASKPTNQEVLSLHFILAKRDDAIMEVGTSHGGDESFVYPIETMVTSHFITVFYFKGLNLQVLYYYGHF